MRYVILALTLILSACEGSPYARGYPPPILRPYQPPVSQPIYTPRQPINCTTMNGMTTCY